MKSEEGSKIQDTTNSHSAETNKTTYLKTLNAYVVCNNNLSKVKIVCGSGLQNSFIPKRLVTYLNLKDKVLRQQDIFGGKNVGP